MDTLTIHNWDKWQSYRSDRGQPPWIKIHRELMRRIEWVSLSDAQRGQLVAIWLLAADRNGVIPASAKIIQKLCHLDTEPDLNIFIINGFIDGVVLASDRRQSDSPEKSREEKETDTDNTMSPPATPKADQVPYQKIVDLYHEVLPTNPRVMDLTATRKGYIAARWKNQLPDLQTWKDFFEFVAQSDFLTGKTDPKQGYRRMNPNLEWLTKESNFIKIAERTYHGKV